MKTAISIPDDLFESAEELAASMGVSRSQLYAEAVRRLIEDRQEAEITKRLNGIYEDKAVPVDPILNLLQLKSLARLKW